MLGEAEASPSKRTMTKEREKTYPGFPNRVRQVPVPAPVLGSLLEMIDDLDELKCTLRVIALLSQKRGYPRFVTLSELQSDKSLARAIPAEDDATSALRIERSLARRGQAGHAGLRGRRNWGEIGSRCSA